MKLFLKISNLCNHNTSTLRTDRQTDGQTTCHSNTARCYAERGKNINRTAPTNCYNISIYIISFHCFHELGLGQDLGL